jgi:hypothetical protein
MTGATVIRWGRSVTGREAKGLEVFGRALEMYEEHLKGGRIHGHREYFSISGDGGFIILMGDLDELMRLRVEPETLDLLGDAGAVVEDLHVDTFVGGSDQTVGEFMGRYTERMGALGLM